MKHTKANIRMIKTLLQGAEKDEKSYECEVLAYDKPEESIYLILTNGELQQISLDGIYRCVLHQDGAGLMCEGRITERYLNEKGRIVKFRVEKGFYKINIKSVDKEEAE